MEPPPYIYVTSYIGLLSTFSLEKILSFSLVQPRNFGFSLVSNSFIPSLEFLYSVRRIPLFRPQNSAIPSTDFRYSVRWIILFRPLNYVIPSIEFCYSVCGITLFHPWNSVISSVEILTGMEVKLFFTITNLKIKGLSNLSTL